MTGADFTCLTNLCIADITINPLHTTGDFSSTRKPIDMLQEHKKRHNAYQYCKENQDQRFRGVMSVPNLPIDWFYY